MTLEWCLPRLESTPSLQILSRHSSTIPSPTAGFHTSSHSCLVVCTPILVSLPSSTSTDAEKKLPPRPHPRPFARLSLASVPTVLGSIATRVDSIRLKSIPNFFRNVRRAATHVRERREEETRTSVRERGKGTRKASCRAWLEAWKRLGRDEACRTVGNEGRRRPRG